MELWSYKQSNIATHKQIAWIGTEDMPYVYLKFIDRGLVKCPGIEHCSLSDTTPFAFKAWFHSIKEFFQNLHDFFGRSTFQLRERNLQRFA